MSSKITNIFFTLFFFIMLQVCFLPETYAQLSLPRIFSNGMVLQRGHELPVWGKASPDSTVIVTLNGVTVSGQADSSGNWRINLPSQIAGGPYTFTVQSGTDSISLMNVFVGDVWFASGQSNMEMAINSADSASAVKAAAGNEQLIREFKIPKGLSNELSDELPAGSAWSAATSQNVGNFSAVAYFFAKNLRQHYNIPIGIINSSYGGSRIESFMSREMLGYDEADTVFAGGVAERQATVVYNKMIHPIVGYPLKGIIWYQGESNADNMPDALAYGENFRNMITGFREIWGADSLPFLWVQLPNYGEVYDEPRAWDAWPRLREGQSSALSLPYTGEAVTIDVGSVDIHPTYKQPVGYRLSLLARKVVYGEDVVYSGPKYAGNFQREDGKIEINYDHIGGGLTARGSQNGEITGFAVESNEGTLLWANAIIEDDKVVVWNDEMPEPSIVRYAWEYNQAGVNLYNAEGLPAAPFRANVNPGFKISIFNSGRAAIEYGQSTTLSWLVFGASSITLNGEAVDSADTITISPLETTEYVMIAVNRDDPNEKDTSIVTVTVLDPTLINRAKDRPASASTTEACCGGDMEPENAVDDDLTTRWSSAWQVDPPDPNLDDNPDDEWITIDLGESVDINMVILSWEAAYGSSYDIEVSYDGYIWRTVYEERASNGGEDNITFDTPASGRYIRIHGIERATQFGYSLWEIAVYGLLSDLKPPSVNVRTAVGNVVDPGTSMKLTAQTTDSDGEIKEVSFYVDDVLLGTDTESPFEIDWTAGDSLQYVITAVVIDDDNLTVQSVPLIIYINDGTMTRFEAENASWTGQGAILNSGPASGGRFLELRDAWVLTFNNVGVSEAKDYLLVMAYQLTFESPKSQFVVVNGDTIGLVEFTAPNTTAWLKQGITIPLKEGVNEIAIDGEWNWMSFDYIAIPGAAVVSVGEAEEVPESYFLYQNYPNPFNPSTVIRYSLPEQVHVSLKIFDILGNEIKTLVNNNQGTGNYEVIFDASGVSSGVYFYRLQAGDYIQNLKMLLLK
ncbi:MAG: discoidin domain-containing protein [Ignavibacteriaceae bacterium]